MKPLVVIPARGGSKGIPGKNIKRLGGKPLIYYTIEAARGIFDDEIICVSTDDKEIKKVVESTGLQVPFLRPRELATDIVPTYNVLLHALKYYEKRNYKANELILLQPTSPFRKQKHIKEALSLYSSHLDMVISVKETRSNPYYILYEENEKGYLDKCKKGDFTRRQDCPKVWELNGAMYIINIQSLKKYNTLDFKKVIKYEMDEISSLDIDTELDWKLAQTILANKD